MTQKMIMCLALATCAAHALHAVVPNFELWNKTQDRIKAEVLYYRGNDKIQKTSLIEPNARFHLHEVDMEQKMLITINNTKSYNIDPHFCVEYGNCYKTAYLSYDNAGLRPQKGMWLFGTTMSGYDNRKNIGEGNINRLGIIFRG